MKFQMSWPGKVVLAAVLVSTIYSARAQFPFGGFGQSSSSSSSRISRSGSSGKGSSTVGVGDAVISVDPETHSLIVIADEDTSKYISQVVSNLDRPQPQVLIKVVFLEVTHNNASDIGVEGSVTKNLAGTMGSMVTNFTVGPSNIIVPSSIIPSAAGSTFSGANAFGLANAGSPNGLFQVLGQDYTVTLRAIATAGNAKVLSRPSIIARNNQPATITVGQSVPLITNVRFDNFGNAINSINYQSVGIILRVTPFISPQGLVQMILSPETSQLVADRSQWVPISGGGTNATVLAPLINTRSADTVVVTPDGQTIIIGGMIENTKSDSESKIPFLGDIPLLGNLFKHKIKSDERTELLIFLTPHIIQAPTEMAMVSARERTQSEAGRGLTDVDLDRFLETLPRLPTNAPPTKASSRNHK
jgi:general secretion pathway protein D